MEDKKRYNYMENVLNNINKNYISLSDEEVKRNNQILEEVVTQIVSKMKENSLFKYSFRRVFYGGSYYDGLRVGNPEEFDLDLLMTLPAYAKPTLTHSNKPGFLHLQLKAYEAFLNQPEAHRFMGLSGLLDDDHYLVTHKVSSWIEGLITKAVADFPKAADKATLITTKIGVFEATIHKGGPAHTLKLKGKVASDQEVTLDVDLVPCFVFGKDKWPSSPYRENTVSEKPEFFIVPKSPGGDEDVTRYWRLSFQEQERVLINSFKTLKPTLKLLKKLRDVLDHKIIASYFIKTIFLWEVEKDKALWDNTLSYVFMTMLKKYKEFLESGEIPYFWNKKHNLLDKAKPITRENMANKLKRIIGDIERNSDDPFIIAKYLVEPSQIEQLKSETVIGKKTLKILQQQTSNSGNIGAVSVLIQNTVTSSGSTITDGALLSSAKVAVKKQISKRSEETSGQNDVLKAVNSVQKSVDLLTKTFGKLQSDNQKIFSFMENLSIQLDEVNTNIGELQKENQMLRHKLKNFGTPNSSDDVCFQTDRLYLTANKGLNQ